MKYLTVVTVCVILISAGCAAKKSITPEPDITQDVTPAVMNFSDQASWLLGYFTYGQMTRQPHSLWYMKEFDEYQLNSEPLEKLAEIPKDDLTIKIVLGSWCPDSRREVPRFMRILDKWQFPLSKVIFIGVDNAKLSPVGEYTGLGIERVPTFIIYKNNIETGRIIENPKTSLEQDMVNILTRSE
jgi:thiol-disulfide isomerase/thioredoxin